MVDVAKHRYVRAQIDHRGQCLRFGAADATLAGGVDLEDAGGFTGEIVFELLDDFRLNFSFSTIFKRFFSQTYQNLTRQNKIICLLR